MSSKLQSENYERLKWLFPKTRYRIIRADQVFFLRESRDPSSILFLDKDGSILGKPNYQINFFVFPGGGEPIFISDWYVESIRDWCRTFEGNVIKRDLTEPNLKLLKQLRRYDAYSFVQFLLKKYSDIIVWNKDGERILLEDPNLRVYH